MSHCTTRNGDCTGHVAVLCVGWDPRTFVEIPVHGATCPLKEWLKSGLRNDGCA